MPSGKKDGSGRAPGIARALRVAALTFLLFLLEDETPSLNFIATVYRSTKFLTLSPSLFREPPPRSNSLSRRRLLSQQAFCILGPAK